MNYKILEDCQMNGPNLKSFYSCKTEAFPVKYLDDLQKNIMACKYLAVNNLNRDFVATKGFSIVFKKTAIEMVKKQFPYFDQYIDTALDPYCNAFYLNPLLLSYNSRVDPHIDRSLRSYLKTIDTPLTVSVLYIQIPENFSGGELVLTNRKKRVGEIKPVVNTLLYFQGNLTHSVNRMDSKGNRLSLVCEQYCLDDDELEQIPEFTIESRKLKY
jgi:hypothetical protein